jgi:hypothetical protein
VLAATVGWQPQLFQARLAGLVGAGGALEQGSLLGRLYLLQGAAEVIERWPWWGVGTQQYVAAAARLLNVSPSERLLVESTPVLMWAEQGVAAPLAWLGLGAALAWLGCRRAASMTGTAGRDLALATAWVAAIQVTCLFQAYFWPGHELWQGGLWLGAALGLWARAYPGAGLSQAQRRD